jgi:ribosomal subunit interface protein
MRIRLRGLGFETTPAIEEHTERRLRFAVGRFSDRIEDVTVRFEDVNGPRGGVDMACRVVARLRPGGAVRVEEREADLYSAIDRAADRIGRALRRELSRRRTWRRAGSQRAEWSLA